MRDAPSASIGADKASLRMRLLEEEVAELVDAVSRESIFDIADALADILYVVCGTALVYGIDLDAVFREVHRSNMTKVDSGVKRRSDGKILKGSAYEPPDLRTALKQPRK